jgi:ribosome biogenesis GTPase A
MNTFWQIVNDVLKRSDILLLVLDARLVDETRNIEIEDKVERMGKPLIYVVNKSDLVERHQLKEIEGAVYMSAKGHLGTKRLREKIMTVASQMKLGRKVVVGVLGYPNVGKSSVINSLKGKASAKTSSISGYTKKLQKVRASNIMFLDTPGVLPYMEKDRLKLNIIGSINDERDPDYIVMLLMERYPGIVEKHYGVECTDDKDEALTNIAVKRKIFRKGNIPDIDRMARTILNEWRKGIIKM